MSPSIRTTLLGACLALALPGVASAAADASDVPAPRSQVVGLRVSVDANGKVQSAQPSDPQAVLNGAAQDIARKLVFTPARKNGAAVSSETNLVLTLAVEKRADGQFGLQLKRAYNGPGLVRVGKMVAPRYQQGRENGALVVVGVLVNADGNPDMTSMSTERMELRVPSTFAEARYLDAVSTSLHGTRFELDKVDGAAVPSRVSVPYVFGGGPKKPKLGEDERRGPAKLPEAMELPAMKAVSAVAGVELATIDYRAPAAAAPAQPATPPAK